MSSNDFDYSERYSDDFYEFRHVVVPPQVRKHPHITGMVLMTEQQWRAMGVQQSRGWEHYAFYHPEPHVLLFRRPLNQQQ